MTAQTQLTSFEFDAKIFQLEGAYFFKSKPDGRVLLHVDLGDVRASVDTVSLMNEFSIHKDSKDAKLIDLVKRSLDFVPVIAAGDKIPNEIIDGSASWAITDAYRVTAHNLVLMRLAQWATGDQTEGIDYALLGKKIEEPRIKLAIQKGFSDAAAALNLKDSEQVVQMIEKLSNELACIEALREYYRPILEVNKILQGVSFALKGDRDAHESVVRARLILQKPLLHYKNLFDAVDAQVIEIASALKNLANVIAFVRETRNQLHAATLIWSEIREELRSVKTADRKYAHKLMEIIYGFAARNFLVTDSW